MTKLKVVHVISAFLTSGAERLVTDLVRFSDQTKFEVSVLSICETSSVYEKELKEKGFKIYSLNVPLEKYLDRNALRRYLYNLSIIPKMQKYLQPNVLLRCHLDVQKIVLLASLFLRIPVKIHTVHSVAHKSSVRFIRFFDKLAFKFLVLFRGVFRKKLLKLLQKFLVQKFSVPLFTTT